MKKFVEFLQEDSGATSIEYALIAAFVSIAIVTALTSVGSAVTGPFENAAGHLNAAS